MKEPWYPLNRRLGGPQSRSGLRDEEENSQPLPGLIQPVDQRYTTDLHAPLNIVRVTKSRRLRYAGHDACMGELRNLYKILVGKSEGKSPDGRPRRGWKCNIRMIMRK
jgi:hypothetical protein